MKTCSLCKQLKPLSDFYKSSAGTASWQCKPCKKEYQKKQWQQIKSDPEQLRKRRMLRKMYRYGMSPEQLVELLASQGYRCASCTKPITEKDHVDHCHTTGKVRGWLCAGCNAAIGHAHDSPSVLRAAAEYLEKHQ